MGEVIPARKEVRKRSRSKDHLQQAGGLTLELVLVAHRIRRTVLLLGKILLDLGDLLLVVGDLLLQLAHALDGGIVFGGALLHALLEIVGFRLGFLGDRKRALRLCGDRERAGDDKGKDEKRHGGDASPHQGDFVRFNCVSLHIGPV